MNNIINLLGIAVSGINDTINQEPTDDPKAKSIWTLVLLAIIIGSVLISRFLPSVPETIKSKKADSEKLKTEKERNAELERLHKIKEKNKRK